MKKSAQDNQDKQPRSELDRRFLSAVQKIMTQQGIESDRAMSLKLERHPDFINRIRNGVQSAPPEAWDTLISKFSVDPVSELSEPRAFYTRTTSGNAVGQNTGSLTQNSGSGSGTFHFKNTEDCEARVQQLEREVAQLLSQLQDKDLIIQLLRQQK